MGVYPHPSPCLPRKWSTYRCPCLVITLKWRLQLTGEFQPALLPGKLIQSGHYPWHNSARKYVLENKSRMCYIIWLHVLPVELVEPVARLAAYMGLGWSYDANSDLPLPRVSYDNAPPCFLGVKRLEQRHESMAIIMSQATPFPRSWWALGWAGVSRYTSTKLENNTCTLVGLIVSTTITRKTLYGTLKCSNEIDRGGIPCGDRHVLPCAKLLPKDVCIGISRHTKSHRGTPVLAC